MFVCSKQCLKFLTLIDIVQHCLKQLKMSSFSLQWSASLPALCLLQTSTIGLVFRRIRQDLIFLVSGSAPNVESPLGREPIGQCLIPEIPILSDYAKKWSDSRLLQKAEPAGGGVKGQARMFNMFKQCVKCQSKLSISSSA